MKKSKSAVEVVPVKKRRPPLTPEARESQLISMATDLIEQRLRDGTASSQETTAIIKGTLGKSRIEMEILREQKKLIEAKTESLQSTKRIEALYAEAMNAMQRYNGEDSEDEDDI